MAKVKDSYLFHLDDLEDMLDLNDTELAEVFRGVIQYALDGTKPEFQDRYVRGVFRHLAKRHDADAEAYEERCKQNSANGSKGGRPKKPNGYDENQTVYEKTEKSERFSEKAKKADMDMDKDMDKDMDEDMDTDIPCAPAGASPLPYSLAQKVKQKVVEEGDLTDLANETWLVPAKIKQLDKDLYVTTNHFRAAMHIRDRYGGFFENAIRSVMPEFQGNIVYATG